MRQFFKPGTQPLLRIRLGSLQCPPSCHSGRRPMAPDGERHARVHAADPACHRRRDHRSGAAHRRRAPAVRGLSPARGGERRHPGAGQGWDPAQGDRTADRAQPRAGPQGGARPAFGRLSSCIWRGSTRTGWPGSATAPSCGGSSRNTAFAAAFAWSARGRHAAGGAGGSPGLEPNPVHHRALDDHWP